MSYVKPKYTCTADGTVNYSFNITKDLVTLVSKQFKDQLRSTFNTNSKSSYFASITDNGYFQIWQLRKYCRCIFSISFHVERCSWADIFVINDKVKLFVYSRESGLVMAESTSKSNEQGENVEYSIIDIPGGSSPGFCSPVRNDDTSSRITLLNHDDKFLTIDLSGMITSLSSLNDFSHPTFLLSISKRGHWIIVGNEAGNILIVDIFSNCAKVLAHFNLINNQLIQDTKGNCDVTSEENVPVPLCATLDEESSHLIVGTRANVLALLRIEYNLECVQDLQLIRTKRIPLPGVNSIALNSTKQNVFVSGWDSKIRVFTFPKLDFIYLVEWELYPIIRGISILETKEHQLDSSEFLVVRSNCEQFSVWCLNASNELV